jgi:hypothetical protein
VALACVPQYWHGPSSILCCLLLQVIAYRLLVYLRTLFSGHPFPPGIERLAALEGASAAEGAEAGGMPPLLGASVSELKAQLLGVLLFADSKVRMQPGRVVSISPIATTGSASKSPKMISRLSLQAAQGQTHRWRYVVYPSACCCLHHLQQ